MMVKGESIPALEYSVAQTSGGALMTLVRPDASPFMWEGWSHDDGRSWSPLARGPFPLYACFNSMITLRSGAMLLCGRFPAGNSCKLSLDDGMTWLSYTLDVSGGWAQGAMYEVRPDEVVYLYGGRGPGAGGKPWHLRAATLRVVRSPQPGLVVEPVA